MVVPTSRTSPSEVLIDARRLRGARGVSYAVAGATMVVGLGVLAGWTFDIQWLKSTSWHGVTMKANAAVAFLLSGLSLALLLPENRSRVRTTVGTASALLVLMIGALTLAQHVFQKSLGIDELLFLEPPGELATASPGRMGPPASSSFTLAGLALLMLNVRTRGGSSPAQWCAAAIGAIATLPVLGYVFGAAQLYGIAKLTGIALHTAIALLLLACGLLAARPTLRPVRTLLLDDAGGKLARRILPAALLLPLILGSLRTVGESQGYFDAPFGRALLILSIMLTFTLLVWLTAVRLSREAAARGIAEQASIAMQVKADRLAATHAQTQNLLDALLDNAPVGLAFFDRQLRCVRANGELARLKGLPADAHIGRAVGEVLPIHTEAVEPTIQRVFETGRSTTNLELAAPMAEQPSHVHQVLLAGFYPVREVDGSVGLVGAVLLDITQRKQLEEQRTALLDSERAARAEAERAARLKDEFLATLSHELRTPLNAIVGWTSILRMGRHDPQDLQQALETIDRNAKVQAELIEDLLDVSRIVSGKLRLDLKTTDLRSTVEAALSAITPAAEAKRIRLITQIHAESLSVRGDPARLQQIVWNLLSNAVKFTPPDGEVRLELTRIESHVQIIVSDTGAGIQPGFLPHVFDRFRQADSSTTRKHGGLGLGLSIVRQLVEMHGGSVRAASAGENLGSTFTVSLPLTTVPHRESRDANDQRPGGNGELVRLQGVRVLVVDDEADARELICRLLRDRGADVVSAGSMSDALKALAERRPDLIVSDIGMPERDGHDLIRAVRQRGDAAAAAVPAIALTAFARPEDRRRSLLAGFQMHIAKPVDPQQLILAVAELTGRADHAEDARAVKAPGPPSAGVADSA